MVAVEREEEVEVRRSCLRASDDEGEEWFGEAVRMLVGEPARMLDGDDAEDSCAWAASEETMVKGARGAGFGANRAPWP